MPEKTKTGKLIFPIIDASMMEKDGWFIKETKTDGVSVRLARLKDKKEVVVQAYIFDTKKDWTVVKAKKWLKEKEVQWIAELDEDSDIYKGNLLKIEKILNGRVIMSAQKETIVKDADGRERVVTETDKGLPKEIVRSPKKIKLHRQSKTGSKGRPINLTNKDYRRKDKLKETETVIETENSKIEENSTVQKLFEVRTPRKKFKTDK